MVTKALKPVPRAKKRPALVSLETLHDLIRKTEAEPASPLPPVFWSVVAPVPVRYALEMNHGWFAQRGIKPGVRLQGIEKAPRPQ